MKRNILYVLMISVLSVIFAVPALSQTATVKGTCKDAQGNPIAGAEVTWHNNDNGRTFKLKTNKKGEPRARLFHFIFLQPAHPTEREGFSFLARSVPRSVR